MSYDMPDALREHARTQGGVVSIGQALAAGMTKAALAWRLHSGRWQPLQRGVYAVFSGQPSREAVLWAAVLRAGRDAVLSHDTAAELTRLADVTGHPCATAGERARVLIGRGWAGQPKPCSGRCTVLSGWP